MTLEYLPAAPFPLVGQFAALALVTPWMGADDIRRPVRAATREGNDVIGLPVGLQWLAAPVTQTLLMFVPSLQIVGVIRAFCGQLTSAATSAALPVRLSALFWMPLARLAVSRIAKFPVATSPAVSPLPVALRVLFLKSAYFLANARLTFSRQLIARTTVAMKESISCREFSLANCATLEFGERKVKHNASLRYLAEYRRQAGEYAIRVAIP